MLKNKPYGAEDALLQVNVFDYGKTTGLLFWKKIDITYKFS